MRLAASLLLVLLGGSAARAGAPVPEEVYRSFVRSYEKGMTSEKKNEAREARSAARDGLRTARSVRRADGTTLAADNTDALERLERLEKPGSEPEDEDIAHASSLLALVSVGQSENESAPARGDARVQAREILARAEFADAAASKTPRKSALERWLEERLEALERWLRGSGERTTTADASPVLFVLGETLRWLLYFCAAALAGFLSVHAVRYARTQGWLKRRGPKGPGGDADLLAADVEDPLSAARRAEEAGDLTEAVRLLYIACLRRLARSGLLVLEANRTNGEYQRALSRTAPEIARVLLPATRAFERTWYGRRRPDPAILEQLRAIHDALPEEERAP